SRLPLIAELVPYTTLFRSDYFQATRGGGNGDYRLVVLAPANVQELVDLIIEGFDIADQYRNPVMILGDGMIGQMMEPIEFKEPRSEEHTSELQSRFDLVCR